MSRKYLAGAAAIVLACSMANPAVATTRSLGTLVTDEPQPASFSIAKASNPNNEFDILTFNLDSLSDLSASLQNLYTSVRGKTYNFSSVGATFYQGTYNGVPGAGTVIGTLAGGSDVTFSGLGAGNYYAQVAGVRAAGAAGGTYALSLLAGRPAAPAPGPGGALVAGAALTALVFRRRMTLKRAAA